MRTKTTKKLINKSITKRDFDGFRQETKKDFDIFRREMLSEFKKYATKDDLWEVKKDLDNMKQEIKTEIQEKFDKILNGQDYLIKKVETALQETSVSLSQYQGQEKKLADHEVRIKVLETSHAS